MFWALTALMGYRSFRTIQWMFRSMAFVSSVQDAAPPAGGGNKIMIIIPALREQHQIVRTLRYFEEITQGIENLEIAVVTTERERERGMIKVTTEQLVRDYASTTARQIRSLHDRRMEGSMAHQLNFAVGELKRAGLVDDSTYLVFYNADSQPHPKTFLWFAGHLQTAREPCDLVQQVAVLFKNFDALGAGRSACVRTLLQSFAVLQTRWTLAHELPRLIRNTCQSRFLRQYANAHCIGHGLFVKATVFNALGGFSERTMTEDLFFGYLARATGRSITPLPFLELVDSPTTIARAMRQKYVWFWGPMLYPVYFLHFRTVFGEAFRAHWIRAAVLCVQGVTSAFSWLLSGYITLFLLMYPIIAGDMFALCVGWSVVLLYGPLQYALVLYWYPRLIHASTGVRGKILGFGIRFPIALQSIPSIIMHSIPPYVSLVMELARKIIGITVRKPKTED